MQTVSPLTAEPYKLEVAGVTTDTDSVLGLFKNNDPTRCVVILSLVADDKVSAVNGDLTIQNDFLVYGNASPAGTAIRAKVKALTDFNEPVYKDIVIVKAGGCTAQSLAVAAADTIALSSAKLTAALEPVKSAKVATYFTNTEPLCDPVTITLVSSDGVTPLAGAAATAVTIVDSGGAEI